MELHGLDVAQLVQDMELHMAMDYGLHLVLEEAVVVFTQVLTLLHGLHVVPLFLQLVVMDTAQTMEMDYGLQVVIQAEVEIH